MLGVFEFSVSYHTTKFKNGPQAFDLFSRSFWLEAYNLEHLFDEHVAVGVVQRRIKADDPYSNLCLSLQKTIGLFHMNSNFKT